MPLTSPTFTATPLTVEEMNSAFASLTSAINTLTSQVEALSAPTAPDLSGYVTQSQLTNHAANPDTHRGMATFPSALIPTGKQALIQYVSVTLSAGTGTATWPTSYASGAIITALAVDTTAAAAVRVSALTTTQATITGTGTDVIHVIAIGYI